MIDEHRLRPAGNTPASRRGSLCCTGLAFTLLLAVQGVSVAADAEPLVQAPQAARGPAQKKYTLRVTKEGVTQISLNADGAKLSEIAADLSTRLGTRVVVGPTMEEQTISVQFSELPLEPALSALAPRVYIDYEIRRDREPAAQGIYLFSYGDPEPVLNAVLRGESQGLLITGNTEDTGKPSADDPLQVRGNKNRLTIISKQQPLAVVAMAIGEVLGVPAEIKYDGPETVDTDIQDTPPEDAIRGVSPNLRLYVRVDVNRSERTLLRIVVVPAAAK